MRVKKSILILLLLLPLPVRLMTYCSSHALGRARVASLIHTSHTHRRPAGKEHRETCSQKARTNMKGKGVHTGRGVDRDRQASPNDIARKKTNQSSATHAPPCKQTYNLKPLTADSGQRRTATSRVHVTAVLDPASPVYMKTTAACARIQVLVLGLCLSSCTSKTSRE